MHYGETYGKRKSIYISNYNLDHGAGDCDSWSHSCSPLYYKQTPYLYNDVRMGPYFVDFEAFQHGTERFLIKELCIIDVDRPLTPLYFIFRSPKAWDSLNSQQQMTYRYQSQHLHHLEYSEGVSLFCKTCVARFIKLTFPNCLAGIFYVMGTQKFDYLRNKFPCFNWCEYNGVTLNTLPTIPTNIQCFHRDHGEHCACLKCYRLYQHYITLPD